MNCKFIHVIAFGFTIVSGIETARAQTTIDLVGTWTGAAQAIVTGVNEYHPDGAASKPAGPHRLREVPFTYRIEGQDGRRFWGTGTSENKSDSVSGVISADGQRIYMADSKGTYDGVVMNTNTLELCYRRVSPDVSVVACNVVKREKK